MKLEVMLPRLAFRPAFGVATFEEMSVSKMLLAVVASLATLVATSSGSQAAFTVTVTGGGVGQTVFTNDAFAPNLVGAQYQANFTGTGIGGNISVSATENAGKFSGLTTNVSLLNFTGSPLGPVTVTIKQDAYTFPINPFFYRNVAIINLAPPATVGTTIATTNQATQIASYSAPASNSSQIAANGGSGPYSITQTFVINAIPNNSGVSIFADTSIFTPLPATGLMAAVGFPLLGLAGAFRRRVLA